MARLRYNGLTATLGAALTSGGTTITFAAPLTSAAGAVPTITGSDTIALSILDAAGNVSEIVSLTAYTSGASTGTIARAQEGTTATAHAAGDAVVHSATVADFASSSGGTVLRERRNGAATADYMVTASASFADLDNTYFSTSVAAVAGSEIEVEFHGQAYANTAGGTAIFAVAINGNVPTAWANGHELVKCDGAGVLYPMHLHYSFVVQSGDLVGGSVPIKIRWKGVGSTVGVHSATSGAGASVPQLIVTKWS